MTLNKNDKRLSNIYNIPSNIVIIQKTNLK